VKLVPGQLNYLALPPGQTAPFDVGALQRAGLPIAPYIEHGSWETGQPDIMFYGRDPYRGVMGMYGNYVTLNGLGTGPAAASADVSVINVQRRLNQEGQSLATDGLWGSRTRLALDAFARSTGVAVPAFGTANYKLVNNRTVRLPAALATAFTSATAPAPGAKTQAFEPSGPVDPEASTDKTPAQKAPFATLPLDRILSIAPSIDPRQRRAPAPAETLPATSEPAATSATPNRTMLYVGVGVGTLALVGLGWFLMRRRKGAA
jgi:hypothetical protein